MFLGGLLSSHLGVPARTARMFFVKAELKLHHLKNFFLHLRLLPKRSLFTYIKDLSGQLCL